MNDDLYRHGCGGILRSASVLIVRPYLSFSVPGLQCERCGEQVIDPDTMRRIEAAFAEPSKAERIVDSSEYEAGVFPREARSDFALAI